MTPHFDWDEQFGLTRICVSTVGLASLELSGPQWVDRYPSSTSLDDLVEPFRGQVTAFINAITTAGGEVRVSATYRPAERAYLMHYSCKIAQGKIAPPNVPAMAGVAIEWDHATLDRSRAAARAMIRAYRIVYPPTLQSNHTKRRAIDMIITQVLGKRIVGADGTAVIVKTMKQLHKVGAGYGVHKLLSDPPHWSDDGH